MSEGNWSYMSMEEGPNMPQICICYSEFYTYIDAEDLTFSLIAIPQFNRF